MTVVLVLCDVADSAALWAARELEGRGLEVEVLTGSVLDSAVRWEHRVSDHGASFAIELFDGRRVSSDGPVSVLNRLTFVPTDRLNRVAGTQDAGYAAQEMHALFLSWLYSIPGPVVNRPSPQGLAGRWRHRSQWACLAASAGLRAAPYRESSTDPLAAVPAPPRPTVTVFAVGERMLAPPAVPRAVAEGCRELARLAGETLLGVDLVLSPTGDWEVTAATATPYFPLAGKAMIDALQEALAT